MNNQLDLSIRIWQDYFNRTKNTGKATALLMEANDLVKCFKIPKDVSEKGKRIAAKTIGDKNVNSKK